MKNPKYVNVFVLTNTFKYAFVCWLRIYTEIRPYLLRSVYSATMNDAEFRHFAACARTLAPHKAENPLLTTKIPPQTHPHKNTELD